MGMSMGGGGQGSDRYRAMSDINVTPMVDIMLVLLIIFMVAAPLLNQGIEVDLPKANNNQMTSDQEPLVVSINPDGVPYLENNPYTIDGLTAKIMAIRTTKPDLVVYVRAAGRASHEQVMVIIGEIQQAGVNKVGLVTQPK